MTLNVPWARAHATLIFEFVQAACAAPYVPYMYTVQYVIIALRACGAWCRTAGNLNYFVHENATAIFRGSKVASSLAQPSARNDLC